MPKGLPWTDPDSDPVGDIRDAVERMRAEWLEQPYPSAEEDS
jgi:hypothetical protein